VVEGKSSTESVSGEMKSGSSETFWGRRPAKNERPGRGQAGRGENMGVAPVWRGPIASVRGGKDARFGLGVLVRGEILARGCWWFKDGSFFNHEKGGKVQRDGGVPGVLMVRGAGCLLGESNCQKGVGGLRPEWAKEQRATVPRWFQVIKPGDSRGVLY